MRFKTRKIRIGNKRVKYPFAFLPKRIDLDTIVWLERYTILQKYIYGEFTNKEYWFTIKTLVGIQSKDSLFN